MTNDNDKKRVSPFSIRIPPKLRAEFEAYADEQEITLTQAILDAMKDKLKNR
jgi:predicted HicB family RNase H-like nuclease